MTNRATSKIKSPIKNLPVRLPGQSSREHFDKFVEDGLMFPCLFAGMMVVVALIEWYSTLMKAPRTPWLWTVVALISVAVACFRVRVTYLKSKPLKLGITGEVAVGQYLEEHLRPLGCQVLHDIPADGFNVDHVVIGPTGVFSVETKTHSKPAKGASSVKYDGETVSVNGFKPDHDPIVQARAQAGWLRDLLERSTGRKVFIQPVVIYPGWFVEPQPPKADVWVLNEKALPTFIGNARGGSLTNEDVHLLAYHLAKYVISKARHG